MTIEKQPSCDDPTEPALLPVETAMQRLCELVNAVPEVEIVQTTAAANRVLATDVVCPMNVPMTTNSAMDGYAIIAGEAFAGRPFRADVNRGEAVRVFTGAVMPAGTDTVVIQEHVDVANDTVRIDHTVAAGRNVRHAGEDLRSGDSVLLKGRRLTAADVGLLASLGISAVSVTRRPPRKAYPTAWCTTAIAIPCAVC